MARANPLDLWMWPLEAARVGAALAETIWCTQAVIGARMPTIMTAMVDPLGADQRELTRMVTEKVDAFGRSHDSFRSGYRSLHAAFSGNAQALERLAGGGVFSPLDWWQFAERSLRFWSTFAGLPGELLRPIHVRVTANRRRLGR